MSVPVPEIPITDFLDELRAESERLPIEGTVETTYRCNLGCVHCYVNEPAGSRAVRERELSTERLLRLVDEVADAGCLNLLLTGGEVLVRRDFAEVYLHAFERGLRVTVFTNGTLVTDAVAELFAQNPPYRVEITLYGATRETFEAVTGVPGSFARCLAGIERLRSRGVRLLLKAMVIRTNAHELDAMREIAQSQGLPFRQDGVVNARVDCGALRDPDAQLDAERLARIELSSPRMREGLAASMAYLADPNVTVEPTARVYTCGAGQMSFTVDPYGTLQLCQLARRNGFDLGHDTFERGWNEHLPRLRERTWQRNDVCGRCTLLPVCVNCPGAAELEHGDPEAIVAEFCELTHRRAHAVHDAVPGHVPDASCCLGDGRLAAGGPVDVSGGCGSCGHAAPEPERSLIRHLAVRRRDPGQA